MSSELAFLTADALLRAYADRTLSPVEATKAALDQIDRYDTHYNGFIQVEADYALAQAKASEARWAAGTPQGLVDGIPTSIKDIVLTRGWPTRRGSKLIDPDQDWPDDAPSVARLREAGAVFLGKTTTPEFGWIGLCASPLTGDTRNPWDVTRSPGGSSGGAATAAATGMGTLHIGTDGAGSVRIPSSFTGLPGLKPSFGKVAAYPPSAFGMLAHVGPMARTVADLALMLDVIAQPDDRDPFALPAWPAHRLGLDAGIKGLRIAYSPTLGYAKVDPEVAAAVAKGVKLLEEAGAIVEEIGQIFPSPRDSFFVLWAAGAAKVLASYKTAKLSAVDPGMRATAEAGAKFTAVDYLAADAERTAVCEAMARFHHTYDLLVTPTMPVPALKLGSDLNDPATETHWLDWSPFTYPFNMTRQPAGTVPCGLTKSGLPIGLQIVGRRYDDAMVLRAMRAFETRHAFPLPKLPG